MAAIEYNILIEKGACFELPLTLTDSNDQPYNLSGALVSGQIRRVFDDQFQAEFQYEVLDIADASINLTLSREQTLSIDVAASVFDIFLIPATGCYDKLIYGQAEIKANVSS